MMIEEETGTYTGPTHTYHGYSAGDFTDVPFTWTKLYPRSCRCRPIRRARSTFVTDELTAAGANLIATPTKTRGIRSTQGSKDPVGSSSRCSKSFSDPPPASMSTQPPESTQN